MNTIQVLSSIETCSRVSSCKDVSELCVRLTELFAVLSPESLPVSKNTLESFFAHGGHLAVALDEDERVIGKGAVIFSYKENETTARVEDVVVDTACRGQGTGEKIMICLIELALAHKVRHIDLTSLPGRFAANSLYEKMGFKKGETNVYRLVLNT